MVVAPITVDFSEEDPRWKFHCCCNRIYHVTRIARLLATKELIFSVISIVAWIIQTARSKHIDYEIVHIPFSLLTIFCVLIFYRGLTQSRQRLLLPYLIILPINIVLLVLSIFRNSFKLARESSTLESLQIAMLVFQLIGSIGGIVVGIVSFITARRSYLYVRDKNLSGHGPTVDGQSDVEKSKPQMISNGKANVEKSKPQMISNGYLDVEKSKSEMLSNGHLDVDKSKPETISNGYFDVEKSKSEMLSNGHLDVEKSNPLMVSNGHI